MLLPQFRELQGHPLTEVSKGDDGGKAWGEDPSTLINYEAWNAGGGYKYVYSEDWEMVKVLREEFGRYAVYFRAGRPFGWQFRISRDRLARVGVLCKLRSDPSSKKSQFKTYEKSTSYSS